MKKETYVQVDYTTERETMEEGYNKIAIPLDEYNALREIASRAHSIQVIIAKDRYSIETKRLVDIIEHILSGEVES